MSRELLLAKGMSSRAHRRASTFNTSRIDHLYVGPHQPGARLFCTMVTTIDGTRLVTLRHHRTRQIGLAWRRSHTCG